MKMNKLNPTEIDELTLCWLAGLLEGEGSFTKGNPSYPNKPIISIQMADEDTIAKVATILGVKYMRQYTQRHQENNWRPTYSTKISGQNAVELMKALYPLMGKRRQMQIEAAIADYNGDRRLKLTPEQVEELRQRARNGENVLELAKEFGVSKSLAYGIRQGLY
jgi:hypothetical protein